MRKLSWVLASVLAAATSFVLPAGSASAANPGPVLTFTPSTNGVYNFGSLSAGQTASQQFRLANSGGAATSALVIALAGSSTFTITGDTCNANSLGPKKSCYITVRYAPTSAGQSNTATLSATSNKPPAYVGVTLNGQSNAALTVAKSGNGSGSVTSNPAGINCGATCSASYAYATSVTLTATAATGSSFAGWSGGGCSGIGTCTVSVTANTTVTATFTLNSYTLGVSKSGNGSGTVTSNLSGIDCGATCSASYLYGTTVTLTATAATGSTFSGWSGAGCSGTGTCVVTIAGATTVTATFTLNSYTLSVNKSGNGAGSVIANTGSINCGATCSGSYLYGTTVTLTATAATGSTFAGWSGGGCSGTGTCVVTIGGNTNVTAMFTLNSYTLNVSKTGTGSGSVIANTGAISCGATCSASYLYGTPVTLTATAATGSTFSGWSGGGCSGTGACVVTIGGDTTVTATFTRTSNIG